MPTGKTKERTSLHTQDFWKKYVTTDPPSRRWLALFPLPLLLIPASWSAPPPFPDSDASKGLSQTQLRQYPFREGLLDQSLAAEPTRVQIPPPPSGSHVLETQYLIVEGAQTGGVRSQSLRFPTCKVG